MVTVDLTDPRTAGRIISGDPTISLAEVIDQLTPEQMRAALHQFAKLATGDIPCAAGTLVLAEAEDGSGYVAGAYEWSDDGEIGGWYDVTGAETIPLWLDQIYYPDGYTRAPDDPPRSARIIDGWWTHNSTIVKALCGTPEVTS